MYPSYYQKRAFSIININPTNHIPIPKEKRVFDIVLSLFILLALVKVYVLIALAILIEGLLVPKNRGPIFYTETRISQGIPFTLIKFRIFKKDAYQSIIDRGEIVHTKKLEHTPGTQTNVGAFLKKFYLDELPQLWNIFIGDMSFVGPRPWNPEDYHREIARGEYRKKVIKAGLTGLVQLHKKDAPRYGGEAALDHEYIRLCRNNKAFAIIAVDARILWHSMLMMLQGEGL